MERRFFTNSVIVQNVLAAFQKGNVEGITELHDIRSEDQKEVFEVVLLHLSDTNFEDMGFARVILRKDMIRVLAKHFAARINGGAQHLSTALEILLREHDDITEELIEELPLQVLAKA